MFECIYDTIHLVTVTANSFLKFIDSLSSVKWVPLTPFFFNAHFQFVLSKPECNTQIIPKQIGEVNS